MEQLRICIDTSVLGGCFDPEFAPWSSGLNKGLRLGVFRPVPSVIAAAEIERAPAKVRALQKVL
jgi:hypothetical protein